MTHHRPLWFAFSIISVMSSAGAVAEEAAHPRWFDPAGISGHLVIAGGGELPDEVWDRFIELAGGENARLVVVPTASQRADDDELARTIVETWRARGVVSVTVLHTRSREQADQPEFQAPLREATGVWFSGGSQTRIAEAYVGTSFETAVAGVLARGGVVGGTSAGAACQSRVMIASGQLVPQIRTGFDLLPDAIIDQHFRQRQRERRLIRAVEQNPGRIGIGIDEGTACVVQGRRLEVLGRSLVTVCQSSGPHRPARQTAYSAPAQLDLTALRRAARARAGTPFPPRPLSPPTVAQGALVLAGGGRMPADVLEEFIELAGGPQALIVVLPTAAPDPLPDPLSAVRMFEKAGAERVVALRARRRPDVESEHFLKTVAQAGGVWFGGGRQWRFVDAYLHTKAEAAFRAVLARGGVIGGSSAGASIQAQYLARGNPLGNRDILAEGYERGLGFLPGVAVDQHFTQRARQADMQQLVQVYPTLLGIGIDEQTALIVRGGTASVAGKNDVYFYDRHDEDGIPRYTKVAAGRDYDLERRMPRGTDVAAPCP